jgi:prevent-host-death family protein
MEKPVNVAELKATLSSHLKTVKRGEEILITKPGKPIAWIVLYGRAGTIPDEHAELIRTGQMRPPRKRQPDQVWDEPLVPDPDDSVLKALLEERESGW